MRCMYVHARVLERGRAVGKGGGWGGGGVGEREREGGGGWQAWGDNGAGGGGGGVAEEAKPFTTKVEHVLILTFQLTDQMLKGRCPLTIY